MPDLELPGTTAGHPDCGAIGGISLMRGDVGGVAGL